MTSGLGQCSRVRGMGPTGEPNTTTGQRFRYTGQQLIGALGLYYCKARFYSQEWRRDCRRQQTLLKKSRLRFLTPSVTLRKLVLIVL